MSLVELLCSECPWGSEDPQILPPSTLDGLTAISIGSSKKRLVSVLCWWPWWLWLFLVSLCLTYLALAFTFLLGLFSVSKQMNSWIQCELLNCNLFFLLRHNRLMCSVFWFQTSERHAVFWKPCWYYNNCIIIWQYKYLSVEFICPVVELVGAVFWPDGWLEQVQWLQADETLYIRIFQWTLAGGLAMAIIFRCCYNHDNGKHKFLFQKISQNSSVRVVLFFRFIFSFFSFSFPFFFYFLFWRGLLLLTEEIFWP